MASMKITADFFELLRTQLNVSAIASKNVALIRRGSEYSGLCPFHHEKSPSFTINDHKRFYHCFGCGAHGDVIKFISEITGLSYKESAIKLAQDNNIEIPKISANEEKIYEEIDQIHNILEMTSEFFQKQLNDKVIKYLDGRSMDAKTIADFSIGFAPSNKALQKYLESKKVPLLMINKAGLITKNEKGDIYEIFRDRVIFPIKNIYGKIVGFGGRTISDDILPKYINSPETIIFKKSETLYGEDKAIGEAYRKGNIIVVEGYMDLITMQVAGFKNSVATLGTAVTEQHIAKLWRSVDEIIICLDGDSAGLRASHKVIKLVLPQINNSKNISFVIMPSGYDPDDVLKKLGVEKMDRLIAKRYSLSEMIWYLETMNNISKTAESRAHLEQNLENYTEMITNNILKNHYSRFFKDSIWQYFSSKKQKARIADLNLPTNMTEAEILYNAILSLIVKLPSLLSSQEICETLSTIEIKDNKLSAFRDWIIEVYSANTDLTQEKLMTLCKRTRFFQIFMLLSGPDTVFCDLSNIETIYNPHLLWNMLMKKHHLLNIKHEYMSLISNMDDSNFSKIQIYQKEIIKTQQEIEQINEALIQNGAHEERKF